jgi:hypothetical protein
MSVAILLLVGEEHTPYVLDDGLLAVSRVHHVGRISYFGQT